MSTRRCHNEAHEKSKTHTWSWRPFEAGGKNWSDFLKKFKRFDRGDMHNDYHLILTAYRRVYSPTRWASLSGRVRKVCNKYSVVIFLLLQYAPTDYLAVKRKLL